MKPAAILIALALALTAAPIMADPVGLSLRDAVDLALASSPELYAQNLAAAAARRDLDNAWNLFLPGISSGLSGRWSDNIITETPITASSSGPFTATLSLGARLSLTTGALFDLRKRRTDWRAADLALEETRARIIRDAEKAYYGLASLDLDLENKSKAVSLAGERYRLAQLRYERGLGTELDALRAQMSELNARSARDKAVADHGKKLAAFRRQLGLPADAPVALTTALEAPAALPADNHDALLDGRVDLRKTMLSIEAAADATERFVAVNRLPLVTLEADWSFRATDPTALRDSLSLGASLAFNADAWLPGSRRDLELRNLRETERRLELKLEQDRRNARDEVKALLQDLTLARNGLALAEGQVSLSERIYSRTREAWERGSATGLELEDAQLAIDAARQSLITGRLQYLSLLIDLGYALNVDWRTLVR